jgi:hypothetical protein
MNLSELQSSLIKLEIMLTASEDRLVVDAPAGVLTAEIRDALMSHKPALMCQLAGMDDQAERDRPPPDPLPNAPGAGLLDDDVRSLLIGDTAPPWYVARDGTVSRDRPQPRDAEPTGAPVAPIGPPGLSDPAAASAIDRAFGRAAGPPVPPLEPDPDELLELVDRCEAAGFAISVWIESIERKGRAKEYVKRLSIRDPEGRRRPPDRIVLPLLAQSRVICGYVSRVDSPFFPDPATAADRRTAMLAAIADDRRLREHNR